MRTEETIPEYPKAGRTMAVALDVGNVLLDFDFSQVIEWASKSAAKPVAEAARWLAGAGLYDRLERGAMTPEAFFEAARLEIGITSGFEEFKAAWNGIFTETAGMPALVRRIGKSCKVVAASNTNRLHLDHILSAFGVMSLLDGVVASCEIGARKPEAAFYDAVARACGVSCAEIAFVDDIAANVEGAVAFGMEGILFRGAKDLEIRLAALGVGL